MSETAPNATTAGPTRADRTLAALDRAAWPLLGAAMAVAAGLILWFGRDTVFSIDEFVWYATSPNLALDDALQPHAGHLLVTSRLVYKAMLETLGADYEAFRVLAAVSVLLTAGLFFAFASRRVGKVVALAPTLILLVFGSDHVHVIVGNAFTVLLALSCGIAALLAIERGDRRGDLLACGLLCLGVATYTVALAFVVGIAVIVLLSGERWRRIWIPVVPVVLYAAWWLWATGQAESSDDQIELANVLLIGTWIYQAASAATGAILGLDYEFGGQSEVAAAGSVVALAGIVWIGWRLTRGRVPAMLAGVLAMAAALWAMQALAPTFFREPDTARFLYPGAIAVLVVAAEAARGVNWTRGGVIAVYAVAAVGVATNLIELRDAGNELRATSTPASRANLGALELVAGRADPEFNPATVEPEPAMGFPFASLGGLGEPPLGSYLAAAESYGGLGFSADELRTQAELYRSQADTLIAAALGIGLRPASPGSASSTCSRFESRAGEPIALELPTGVSVLDSARATPTIGLRRFGTETEIPLGGLAAGERYELDLPADGAPDPWVLTADAPAIRVCEGR